VLGNSKAPSQELIVPSTVSMRSYFAEFEYRLNRRCDLAVMIPRLTWATVRTTP
jgi:hypothetical protein